MDNQKENRSTEIILASGSPRRRELLSKLGLEFQVLVSDASEEASTRLPGELVEQLSRRKARAGYEKYKEESAFEKPVLIIGADTLVACGDRILGKPADVSEAAEMLELLQGSAHEVYTGVTLLYAKKGEALRERTFHEVARVYFYPMTREEIADYVASGEPMDKAGAYGIQGLGAKFVRGIEGDYNTVVGLPIGRLYQEAKDWI